MRRIAALTLLLALPFSVGCPEPPKLAQMDELVSTLSHLKEWDPIMQAKGQLGYDSIMGYGPDMHPVLVDHLTDETVTAIYDEISGRNPKICDLVLLMLLQLTHHRWQDFAKDGLFISSVLPNPAFCIKWDRETKFKVQRRFRHFLEFPEEDTAARDREKDDPGRGPSKK
jgi:hypothetical protein